MEISEVMPDAPARELRFIGTRNRVRKRGKERQAMTEEERRREASDESYRVYVIFSNAGCIPLVEHVHIYIYIYIYTSLYLLISCPRMKHFFPERT